MSQNEKTMKEFFTEVFREVFPKELLKTAQNEERTPRKEEFGDIKLAMRITGLSQSTIYKLNHRGEIPSYKVGRALRFKEVELIAWMNARRTKSNANLITEINAYNRKRRR